MKTQQEFEAIFTDVLETDFKSLHCSNPWLGKLK